MQTNQAGAAAPAENRGMAGPAPNFAWVYEHYRERVRAYAGRLLGPEEAEDVTQEVFLRISRSLGTLEDPAKLTSWVYAVTVNAARDCLRRRASRPALASVDPGGEGGLRALPDLHSRTAEESAIRKEMVECYLDYVRRLRPIYYEVYALAEFEHLSGEEIARQLSLPLATVKMRLHRARSRVNADLRRHCRCYTNERGELMGEPKPDR